MLTFSKLFKLYIFKDRNQAELAIRVSDTYVQTFTLPIDSLKQILTQWNTPQGFNDRIQGNHWTVQHKRNAPRPTSEPCSYVRFAVFINWVGHNFRVDATDMIDLEKDFYYQINNKMYWDK